MSRTLHQLNNLRILRAQARAVSMDVLEEMLEKVRIVAEEMRQQREEQQRLNNHHYEKLQTWLALMAADGIDPLELVQQLPDGSPKNGYSRTAKYCYRDLNGKQQFWTGRGRTPKVIATALAEGKSLYDFLIN
ncbi:H-NS family nucleoid-associated regulatory protein [Entomohabitans teleogrylli]|uniref:H-NS family histone-like protein n=1 Tax=Entomohabitans teleogrylli TaxID=1384589 RepID=UPI00073D1D58|nr:H-NS family nucleoid-associated regulatory protein [Entomohabitans teleogrylli]